MNKTDSYGGGMGWDSLTKIISKEITLDTIDCFEENRAV